MVKLKRIHNFYKRTKKKKLEIKNNEDQIKKHNTINFELNNEIENQ
jgi:hypothetical protein